MKKLIAINAILIVLIAFVLVLGIETPVMEQGNFDWYIIEEETDCVWDIVHDYYPGPLQSWSTCYTIAKDNNLDTQMHVHYGQSIYVPKYHYESLYEQWFK